MKLPVLKAPIWLNVILITISVILGCFSLLFGIAHIIEGITGFIEGGQSEIPITEQLLGWIIVIFLTVIGVVFLILAMASVKGINYMLNRKKGHPSKNSRTP